MKKDEKASGLIPRSSSEIATNNDFGYHRINDDLYKRVQQVSGLLTTDKNRYDRILDNAAEDILGHEVKRNALISRIDFDNELAEFLTGVLETTAKLYKSLILNFREYCQELSIEFFKVNRSIANQYIKYLVEKGRLSNNSIRLNNAALSSFFSVLHSKHYQAIPVNPFIKLKLPPVLCKNRKDKVTKNDVKVVLNEFKRIGRADYVCLIKLLNKYGWRIGIFEKMVIDADGSWTSVSKGHVMNGRFTAAELREINSSKMLDIKQATASAKIKNTTARLFDKGLLSCAWSPHDLRRKKIAEVISKNGAENFARSSRLFHKNPNVTMRYVEDFYT